MIRKGQKSERDEACRWGCRWRHSAASLSKLFSQHQVVRRGVVRTCLNPVAANDFQALRAGGGFWRVDPGPYLQDFQTKYEISSLVFIHTARIIIVQTLAENRTLLGFSLPERRFLLATSFGRVEYLQETLRKLYSVFLFFPLCFDFTVLG